MGAVIRAGSCWRMVRSGTRLLNTPVPVSYTHLDVYKRQFLDNALKTNPLKGEYFLPSVVSQLLSLIHILALITTTDRIFGM